MPSDRDRFIQALAGAIDNVALALEGERVTSPNAFQLGASQLRVIARWYDAASDYVRSDLDEATGTLRVRLPGPPADGPGVPRGALFEPVVVRYAIENAYSAWLYARFSGVAPHEVAASERAYYADYLARLRATPPAQRRTTPATTEMSRFMP